MPVQKIPIGTLGFDCNVTVSPTAARSMAEHGYRFAVRYVRRGPSRPSDVSPEEIAALHHAGLAVMPVQHVESESSWVPSQDKGLAYGNAAVAGACAAGIPFSASLWLDLEGVAVDVPAATVIAYCNAWWTAVDEAGFLPGIYVGWHAGLNATQLYRALKFKQYWAAYNLNRDQYPIVRGIMMKQRAPKPGDVPHGLPFPIDVNVVSGDAFGDLPTAYAPDEWSVGT